MPSMRGLQFQDQGVNWTISFEYLDAQGVWQSWNGALPADLHDLKAEYAHMAFTELAMAIARGQGIPEFGD